MKRILFIAAASYLFIACNDNGGGETESKVFYSDLVAENLKGDIASYEQTPYAIDSAMNMGEMDSCCISITEYDENGNSVKNISKDSKGNIKSEGVITRHSSGLFLSMRNTENGKMTGGFDAKIDENNKYTYAAAIDSNGNTGDYYTDIIQNEVGEVIGWKQYDKDSVYRQTGESVYDGHKFMNFTLKDSVGTVKSKSSSKYNDKGEQIESSNTNITKDSTTTTVTTYQYPEHDEQGNWTKRITFDDKGKATKVHIRKYTYRTKEE